ncbi:MAG TPA: OsmC family protein [Anaerolineae bacterium]|nr:OsmC family protein [Anaerolineae bacterium]
MAIHVEGVLVAAKSEVTVKWTDRKQFVGVDSTKHSVVMSAQDAENGTGVKPSDMLLLALGGCSGVDVVSILTKQRRELSRFEMHVTGEQDDQGWPRPFRKIHVEYVLEGKGLTEKAVERAIALSHDTYCSVGSTVSGVAEITYSYQIIDKA